MFDHTSILRFLETRFGARGAEPERWRREHTGDLTSAFNFAAPNRANPQLPTVSLPHREFCAVTGVTVPPNATPPQEPGSKPAPSGVV